VKGIEQLFGQTAPGLATIGAEMVRFADLIGDSNPLHLSVVAAHTGVFDLRSCTG